MENVVILFGSDRILDFVRRLRRASAGFREGFKDGAGAFDQAGFEVGQNLGGIHGKAAFEALTIENQTVEVYDHTGSQNKGQTSPRAIKRNRLFFLLAVATLLVAVAVAVLASDRPTRPPDAPEVAGVWSGYGDQWEFLRLELDADRTGYLSVIYIRGNPAELYRVESWRVSDWSVEIKTRPVDAGAEAITFSKLRYGTILLEGNVAGSGWKRQIKLYGERDWLSRAVPAQERIARFRKNKK